MLFISFISKLLLAMTLLTLLMVGYLRSACAENLYTELDGIYSRAEVSQVLKVLASAKGDDTVTIFITNTSGTVPNARDLIKALRKCKAAMIIFHIAGSVRSFSLFKQLDTADQLNRLAEGTPNKANVPLEIWTVEVSNSEAETRAAAHHTWLNLAQLH